jgi:hypothetical protein
VIVCSFIVVWLDYEFFQYPTANPATAGLAVGYWLHVDLFS